MEFVETAITANDIVNAIKQAFGKDGDGSIDILPQEVTDLLESLSDGEQGNNDIETLLVDVNNNLQVIDQRLNAEFMAINDCLGLIATCFLTFFSFKVITWLYNLLSR